LGGEAECGRGGLLGGEAEEGAENLHGVDVVLPDLEAGRAEVDGELAIRGGIVMEVEGDGGGDVFEETDAKKGEAKEVRRVEREAGGKWDSRWREDGVVLDGYLTDKNERSSGGLAVLLRVGLAAWDWGRRARRGWARDKAWGRRAGLTIVLAGLNDGEDLIVRSLSEDRAEEDASGLLNLDWRWSNSERG
jgi:hypothetical protein